MYGEKRAFERAFSKHTSKNGNELVTIYEIESSLRVTNTAKKYPDYDAYEWVNLLENTGSKKTDIIAELWDCDVHIPFPKKEKRKVSAYCPDKSEITQVISPLGANVGAGDFSAQPDDVNFNMPDYLFPGKR